MIDGFDDDLRLALDAAHLVSEALARPGLPTTSANSASWPASITTAAEQEAPWRVWLGITTGAGDE